MHIQALVSRRQKAATGSGGSCFRAQGAAGAEGEAKVGNLSDRKRLPQLSVLLAGALSMTCNPWAEAGTEMERALSAYEQGHYRTAYQLIRRDAEHGSAQAQHVLGVMYRKGLGVDADEYTAFEWCRQAAENGLLEAQFQLGLMYLQGEGVTEDDEQAQHWLWIAADRGYPQASEVLQYIFSMDYTMGC